MGALEECTVMKKNITIVNLVQIACDEYEIISVQNLENVDSKFALRLIHVAAEDGGYLQSIVV